jgi:hypothetical protein
MSDYDRWLQQPYEDAAERAAAIDSIVEEILDEEEFNPANAETFLEAICEGCLEDFADKLQVALDDPKPGHAELGKVIYNAVYDYWQKRAEDEAVRRYDNRDGGDF